MPVISTTPDRENLALTIVAEFPATPERIWQIWEDPRQLEKWWGPPTYPATFGQHDFHEGGEARYFMTSPEGEKFNGHWVPEEYDGRETRLKRPAPSRSVSVVPE